MSSTILQEAPTIQGVHPYADKFPMLPDSELEELAESIKAVGLLEPVVATPEGLLIDGRNRSRACELAGIEPTVTVYGGSDIAEQVIARNVTRRHMSTGARAMSTALVLSADGRRENGRWKRGSVDIGESHNISTWQDALKRCGVILDFKPDLSAKVIDGDVSLHDAFQQADSIRRSADAEKIRAKELEKQRRQEEEAEA